MASSYPSSRSGVSIAILLIALAAIAIALAIIADMRDRQPATGRITDDLAGNPQTVPRTEHAGDASNRPGTTEGTMRSRE